MKGFGHIKIEAGAGALLITLCLIVQVAGVHAQSAADFTHPGNLHLLMPDPDLPIGIPALLAGDG